MLNLLMLHLGHSSCYLTAKLAGLIVHVLEMVRVAAMAIGRAQIYELLQHTALFATAQPATLTRLCNDARVRVLQRNEVVFLHQDPPRSFYVVASGSLRVFVTSYDGAEPTIAMAGVGDHFGELGLIDDQPRSASVAATRRSEVLEIPRDTFNLAFNGDPGVARQMITQLSSRLRRTSDHLADLTFLDLGGRLAKYLVGEMDRQGTTEIELEYTQTELGQMLGGARQTVNQLLASLERSGLIQIEGKKITAIDHEQLRHRALSAG
jgi:CRP/FNR family transcriptional regulator, cyclic AMP receptor protein